MFRPFLSALLLLPLASHAATESAPLDVSLTIKESCRVERREREAAPPEVNCAFDSPYRVQASQGKQPPPMKLNLQPARWEVIF